MAIHMKTTVELSDAIGRRARQCAEREGTTLRALIEEGLRRILAGRAQTPEFRLRKASFGGQGLDPELSGAGWERIREVSYGDRS